MKRIKLTQDKYGLVDDQDYSSLAQHRWHTFLAGGTFYAARHDPANNKKIILMHRAIMSPPKDMVVDHINGNGLDNRRGNLRIVSRRVNSQNTKHHRRSNLVGVTPKGGKYIAQVVIGGEHKYLGLYETAQEAQDVYFRTISLITNPSRPKPAKATR